MANWARKFLYRIFCVLAMLVSVYLIVDFLVSGTFDYRIFTMFLLLTVVEIWGIIDWRRNYLLMQQKESELKLYKHYIRPLEELVKEIRAKQHEFDNHVNAILNMHLTVNDYEELVARQSAYITEVIRDDDSRRYRAPAFIKTEVEVKSLEIISGISEHHLIEIVGTLVDNAYEACTKEMNRVVMELDSENDRLVFLIKNQLQGMKLKNIHRFFEKGYSTKTDSDRHGLGLYNAKMLIGRYHGEIVVSMEKMNGADFICMKVVV